MATLKERSGAHPSHLSSHLAFSLKLSLGVCVPMEGHKSLHSHFTGWAQFFALAPWALKLHPKAQKTHIIRGDSLILPIGTVPLFNQETISLLDVLLTICYPKGLQTKELKLLISPGLA